MVTKVGTLVVKIRVVSPWGSRPGTADLDERRLRDLQSSIRKVSTELADGNGDASFEILDLIHWERDEVESCRRCGCDVEFCIDGCHVSPEGFGGCEPPEDVEEGPR